MAAMDAGRATSDRLRAGGVVLVVDDATDPPQASLVCAAGRVTPAAVNFLATHGRGLVCLTLTRERMRQLGIPLMTSELSHGKNHTRTAFVSVSGWRRRRRICDTAVMR